ncbi:MAG: rod shape-determining protein MreC [Burkholderiaceae bacterium]|nr:rod shape-determining protein MreC [Burkholderiaceae bacterium]
MEHSPPPLFRQGAPAFLKMALFALLAFALLVADSRMHTLGPIRQVINAVLYPLQRAALLPRSAFISVNDYFSSLSELQKEIKNLQQQQLMNAQSLQQSQILETENAHLRKMLATRDRMQVKSVLGEILYDARDAFTRKIVLNRGSQDGVEAGQPVIDDSGVVGQVTRVFPLTSEITLLTDKDQAIPVQVVRNGLRSVAYGRGQSGLLDMRFLTANADLQTGDILVTSGIDGVYPPGLSVAKVAQIENVASGTFSRILCQPLAGIDRNRQLLILLVDMNVQPRPAPEESSDKPGRRRRNEASAPSSAPEPAPTEETQ